MALATIPLLLLLLWQSVTSELVPGAACVLLCARLVLLEASDGRCPNWSPSCWQDVVVVVVVVGILASWLLTWPCWTLLSCSTLDASEVTAPAAKVLSTVEWVLSEALDPACRVA